MKPTIILDLGGVILPLNTEATYQKFLNYTNINIKAWLRFGQPHPIIQQFELGKITEKEFFEELKYVLRFEKECYYLKESWNAMLMPIPQENINFIKELSKEYQLILLSNTCETHIQWFEEMLLSYHHINGLESLFNKTYYSCRIGLRKPDQKLFQKVIKDNHLDLHTTVYFDDTLAHIEAARKLNIKSQLYTQNQLLEKELRKYLFQQEQILIKS